MAWCNCAPQSQSVLPKTSPVKHWLWTRTNTGSLCTATTLLFTANAAQAQGKVRLGIDKRGVSDQIKIAKTGWHIHHQLALDQSFALAAILDQIFDTADLQIVAPAKLPQIGKACHAAIRGHDFADDRRFFHACQSDQIDASLGMTSSNQCAAGPRAQTGHMPLAHDDVSGGGGLVDRDQHRAG